MFSSHPRSLDRIGAGVHLSDWLPALSITGPPLRFQQSGIDRHIVTNAVIRMRKWWRKRISPKEFPLPIRSSRAQKRGISLIIIRRKEKPWAEAHLRTRSREAERPDPSNQHMRSRIQGQIVGIKEPQMRSTALAPSPHKPAIQKQIIAFIRRHMNTDRLLFRQGETAAENHHTRRSIFPGTGNPATRPRTSQQPGTCRIQFAIRRFRNERPPRKCTFHRTILSHFQTGRAGILQPIPCLRRPIERKSHFRHGVILTGNSKGTGPNPYSLRSCSL